MTERIATTEVKRQVVGDVGIDLLAGPNEALVLADETADRNSSRPTSWRRRNTVPTLARAVGAVHRGTARQQVRRTSYILGGPCGGCSFARAVGDPIVRDRTTRGPRQVVHPRPVRPRPGERSRGDEETDHRLPDERARPATQIGGCWKRVDSPLRRDNRHQRLHHCRVAAPCTRTGSRGPEQAREFTDTARSDPVALHSLTETQLVDSICCY